MLAQRFYHTSETIGNYVYVIGGNDGTQQVATVERANANANGTLGAWQSMPAMTIARQHPASAVYGDYVYVSGGVAVPFGEPLDSVERAFINLDGSIGPWEVISQMPIGRELHEMVAVNGYLYIIGGYTGSIPAVDDVWASEINGSGELGIWENQNSIQVFRASLNVVADNNFIYVLGGNSSPGETENTVEFSKINPDGTLDPWQYTSPTLTSRSYQGGAIVGNDIYMVGGADSCSFSSVEKSSINPDGSLSAWEAVNSMTLDRKGLGLVALNGNLYATGGGGACSSYDVSSSVEWAHVDIFPSGTNPVVFVPGMTASWSHKGLINNQSTNYSDWQLIPGSDYYYKSIFDSLTTAGLEMNQSMFAFGYDWTSQISQSASSLNSFLQNEVLPKNAGQKANIISHSMGGLVVAYCYEKISGCSDKINKIISAGSPYQGAVDAYPLWEGGKIEETNIIKKLLFKILLDRRASPEYATNVSLIHAKAKGLGDIMPIFNYVNGKQYVAMSPIGRNLALESLINPSTLFKDSLTTLWGTSQSTSRNLNVTTPDRWEQLNGLWPDGKPISKVFANGDNSVLDFSADLDGASDNESFGGQHTEYFRDSAVLQKMLTTFNLSGSPTIHSSSPIHSILVFFLHSPATLMLKDSQGNQVGVLDETGKSVWIFNPTNDTYTAEVTGIGNGDFGIQAYFINGESDPQSQEIESTINLGQKKNYHFKYTGQSDSSFINSSNDYLQSFKIHIVQSKNKKAILISNLVEKLLFVLKISPIKTPIILAIRTEYFNLINTIRLEKSVNSRFYLLLAAKDLFNLLTDLDTQYGPDPIKNQAQNKIQIAQSSLDKFKQKKKFSTVDLANLQFADENLTSAKNYFSSHNPYPAFLLSSATQILTQ